MYDVIVIGAGIAGLEAAHELNSTMDVVVLEAQDRIGGRTYTYNYSNMALDYGGSWIHGLYGLGHENPIYEIAKTNNINFVETYMVEAPDASLEIFYNASSGKEIDSLPVYYEEDLKPLVDFFKNTKEKDVRELKTVLNDYYKQDPQAKENPTLYWHLMEWSFEQEEATDIENLSSENIITGQYFNGDETEGIFPEGYTQIANCLAQGLNIRHATVTKVDHNNDTIIVSTDKGDLMAKHVVITVPLGVLQNNMIEFSPPLLENKTQSINNLGMATMDKIYLIFEGLEKPFWDTEYTYIHRVTDKEKNDIYPETWKIYFNLYKYTKKPILLVFHTGSSALEMENKSDDDLTKEAMQVLGEMYPGKPILEPQIKRTKWAVDPLSWGSYSFIPVRGNTSDFDRLAEPVKNKLFFAGEATSKYYFGSVHGAYISGYRAAQEILNLKGNVDSPYEQLEHGINSVDIICKGGFKLINKDSTENVDCIPN